MSAPIEETTFGQAIGQITSDVETYAVGRWENGAFILGQRSERDLRFVANGKPVQVLVTVQEPQGETGLNPPPPGGISIGTIQP